MGERGCYRCDFSSFSAAFIVAFHTRAAEKIVGMMGLEWLHFWHRT
jgi:hypothetical protein